MLIVCTYNLLIFLLCLFQELLLYLLQLLQALKFESSASEQRSMRLSTNAISHEDSGLADFLIDRSVRNPVLGNRFHWYLMVEVALEDKQVAKVYGKVWYKYMEKLKKVMPTLLICQSLSDRTS